MAGTAGKSNSHGQFVKSKGHSADQGSSAPGPSRNQAPKGSSTTSTVPLSGTSSNDLSAYANPGKGTISNGAGMQFDDLSPWC